MAGVLMVLSLVNKIDEIKNHPLDNITVNEGLADGNIKDYTNIVVFGVDSRANALHENTRSDSTLYDQTSGASGHDRMGTGQRLPGRYLHCKAY